MEYQLKKSYNEPILFKKQHCISTPISNLSSIQEIWKCRLEGRILQWTRPLLQKLGTEEDVEKMYGPRLTQRRLVKIRIFGESPMC